MSVITGVVTDQVITLNNTPDITAGDKNNDKIQLSYSSEWNDTEKVAIFFHCDDYKTPITVLENKDGTFTVPSDVIKSGFMYFGVKGVKNDKVITTDLIEYRILDGATEERTPSPTLDIYQQLLSAYHNTDALYKAYDSKFLAYDSKLEKLVKNSSSERHMSMYVAGITQVGTTGVKLAFDEKVSNEVVTKDNDNTFKVSKAGLYLITLVTELANVDDSVMIRLTSSSGIYQNNIRGYVPDRVIPIVLKANGVFSLVAESSSSTLINNLKMVIEYDDPIKEPYASLVGYHNGSIPITKNLTPLTLTEGYNKVGYGLKNDTTIKLKKNKIYKLAIQFRYSLTTAPTIQKYMNNFYINVQKGSSSAIYTGIGGIKSFNTIITDECVIERVFDTLNLDSDDLSLQIPSVTTLDEVKEYTDVKVMLYELASC